MSTSGKTRTVIKILLACGLFSSLICIATDIIAAVSWEDYNYVNQSVSELSAIGAPTRPFVVPLLIVSTVLTIAFGIGVLELSDKKRVIRITGILLIIFGFVCIANLFFPMNLRGDEQSFKGTMHLIFTGINVLLLILVIGFGAFIRGKFFRIYSVGTILSMLVFGVLVSMQAPHVEAGLPTPWLGVMERVSYYLPYMWILVLAAVILRAYGTIPQMSLEKGGNEKFPTERIKGQIN